MKKFIKKIICLIMCLFVVGSSVSVVTVAAGGNNGAYPEGVTAEQALAAVDGTDRLVNSAVPLLTGHSLKNLVTPMIYSSESLSSMLVQMYISLEESSDELANIGIDISVKNVAAALSGYPEVSAALSQYSSWSEVNLDGVNWGVTEKNGFATAMGAAFSPLNDVLYMLLCSGTYEISGFIKIKGSDGYSKAIVPMLNSLKCPGIMTQEQFSAQANADKNSMVKNIILPILSLLEKVFEAPASTLTDSLPSFAYFSESGEMDKCMGALMEPITSNPLVEVAVWLKIIDLDFFSFDIETMLGSFTSGMGDGSLKLAEIDMEALSKCGSVSGNGFVSDKGKAYVVIMRWLVDTLKLNSDNLDGLMNTMGSTESVGTNDFLKTVLSKDTDAIVKTMILLFTPIEPGEAEAMVYPGISSATVQYTPNLTEADYARALGEMDDLLDDFVKEGGDYNSIDGLLSSAIYSNSNINSLVVGIYSEFEKNGITDLLVLLGIDVTPKGVAAKLTESDYKNAAKALNKSSWEEVSLNGISWGFNNGSRKGFQNALTAVLRPLYPLLRVLLAEDDIVIMDSITLKGSDGYNTSIIPILEALGCESSDIKTYEKYKRTSDTDSVMKDILDPVFDLVDEICEKPVDTLTEKLPNIVYFMNSGSLEKCINNLMLPVTAFSHKLSGVYDVKIDMTALTSQIDMNALLSGMLKGTGMNIAEFDVNALANMGTAEKRTSKQVKNGKNVEYTYVVADKTDVFMTLVRVLAKTMKLPGNENLLMSSMGEGDTFSSYSSSFSDQIATMTEDELIEWLFNLFFKERVKAELVVDEDYSPTIIYKEAEKNYTWLFVICGYLLISAIIGAIVYFNRKRLYY